MPDRTPPGSRKIDCALTDMRDHLDWLRAHRDPTDPTRKVDIAREIGVTECMDMLARYGAKIIDPEPAVSAPGGTT